MDGLGRYVSAQVRRLSCTRCRRSCGAQDGLSATRDQSQSRSDRDDSAQLKTNALDLGIRAIPIADPAFETVPLFEDELVAILPADLADIPKKVTPAFLSRRPRILGTEELALRRTVAEWVAPAGPPLKPVMEFYNVEGIQ